MAMTPEQRRAAGVMHAAAFEMRPSGAMRELRFFGMEGQRVTGSLDRMGPPLPPGGEIGERPAFNHHLLRTIWGHIVGLIASVGFGLDDGGGTRPSLEGDVGLELVNDLGPLTLGAMGADMWMLGDAMAIKDRAGAARGVVQQLVYVSPQDVTVHIVERGSRLILSGYTVGGYHYNGRVGYTQGLWPGGVSSEPVSGTQPGEYLPDDFLHIVGKPDPRYSGMKGLNLTPAAMRMIAQDLAQTDYTVTVLNNSGAGPIISPKDETQANVEELRSSAEWIVQQVSGTRRGQAAVLPSALEINRSGLNPAEMMIDRLYRLPEARLGALYDLSATMIHMLVGLENAPWSHLAMAREQEAEQVTTVVCKALADGLNRQFMLEFSPDSKFKFDTDNIRVLQEDVDKHAARLVMLKQNGILTAQQVAEELGYTYQAEAETEVDNGGDQGAEGA